MYLWYGTYNIQCLCAFVFMLSMCAERLFELPQHAPFMRALCCSVQKVTPAQQEQVIEPVITLRGPLQTLTHNLCAQSVYKHRMVTNIELHTEFQ